MRESQGVEWRPLCYAKGPDDNPLKGFMPFSQYYEDPAFSPVFPHSMEWLYLPLSCLMDGERSFTFSTGLEPQLEAIAARGHQVALRVYLDYPCKESGLPSYLRKQGVQVRRYDAFGGGECPDYSNPTLMNALIGFIRAFGASYDGDPRIGFVTVGLIGFWGEWHTYPYDGVNDPQNWMPSAQWQTDILRAYVEAFVHTKLLVRYPIDASVHLPIGYHDDSFAFSTLYEQPHFFMRLIEEAKVLDKWRSCPIGGELRPELQNGIWARKGPEEAEDFDACVRATHASWLINQGVFMLDFLPGVPSFHRALHAHRCLGYELFVDRACVERSGHVLSVSVEMKNLGVAPFYYDWEVELGFIESTVQALSVMGIRDWRVSDIMPGEVATVWRTQIPLEQLPGHLDKILLRVKNPLTAGQNLRFSNVEQDADVNGWLTLWTCGF